MTDRDPEPLHSVPVHQPFAGFRPAEVKSAGAATAASTAARAALARLLALVLILFFFVAPRWIYWRHLNINPDAISYWGVGRSLTHHQGLVWSIKPYFYPDDGQVIKPAIGYISVPFTLLLGALQWLGLGFRACTVFSGFLGLLDAWLVYRLARLWCGRLLAACAAILFISNPEVVRATTTLWTEPLALALSLGAYLIACRSFLQWRSPELAIARAGAAGILLAVAYLVRPSDLVYLAAITAAGLLRGRRHQVLALLLGAAAAMIPYWTMNWAVNGSPFFTMYGVLSRTLFYGDAMYTGFDRHYPSSLVFLRQHGAAVLAEILRNERLCLDLLTDPGNLGILNVVFGSMLAATAIAALILWISRWFSPRTAVPPNPDVFPSPVHPRKFPLFSTGFRMDYAALALLLGAALNLAGTIVIWSTHEEPRFLLGSWVLILILSFAAFDGIARLFPELRPGWVHCGWRCLVLAAALIAVTRTLIADSNSVRMDQEHSFPQGGPSWREIQVGRYQQLARVLAHDSTPGAVLAGSDPWMLNYTSGHPVVLLPALRPGELKSFVVRYRPAWIVADTERMPDARGRDDFSMMPRRTWRQRDWTLSRLAETSWLKPVATPVQPAGDLVLYRVTLLDRPHAAMRNASAGLSEHREAP